MNINTTLFELLINKKTNDFIKFFNQNQKSINVNILDVGGNYLIYYAINFNEIGIAKMLIEKGAYLDVLDSTGMGLLFNPIKNNMKEMVEFIVSNDSNIGASVFDVVDSNSNIPLHYAINSGNLEMLNIILEKGKAKNLLYQTNENSNSLHMSVFQKKYSIIKRVLEKFIECGYSIDKPSSSGENILHLACSFQLRETVKLILKYPFDVNKQDYKQQYTALHYVVDIADNGLFDILLSHKEIDLNIQDYSGNTPLHKAIETNNINLSEKLITHPKINLNIYNIYLDIPLHLYLINHEKLNISEKTVSTLIKKSSMNLQSTFGNSCFLLLVKTGLWKKYINILETKKINIFVTNKRRQSYLNYVDPVDEDIFKDMIVKSYLHILKFRKKEWTKEWENVCKFEDSKPLSKDDMQILNKYLNNSKPKSKSRKQICYKIILKYLDKLIELFKNKTINLCSKRSYPIAKDHKCINYKSTAYVSSCSFIGSRMDILVGLIYLLKKHNNTCAVIDDVAIYDDEMEGLDEKKNINSEIIWRGDRLLFIKSFASNFRKCISGKRRFIIIPVGIELEEGSHSNYLIYDKTKKELERFEPYGGSGLYKFDYNKTLFDSKLSKWIKKIEPDAVHYTPNSFMNNVGFQHLDINDRYAKRVGDPGGFCAVWSVWYTDMRLKYYSMDRKKLIKRLIKSIMLQNLSFKIIIRNYTAEITTLRDKYLHEGDISVNDILNNEYTDEQYHLVISGLKKTLADLGSKIYRQ